MAFRDQSLLVHRTRQFQFERRRPRTTSRFPPASAPPAWRPACAPPARSPRSTRFIRAYRPSSASRPRPIFRRSSSTGAAQTDGTFFSGSGNQHIALLADLTEDTDEFDQHVIAHEFGHYIEFNFSRADNIGGAHGLGDKLDPRVAFGEGFGYAFAAIVLNDPVARDSFVDGTDAGLRAASTSRRIRRPIRSAHRTATTAAGAANRPCGRSSGTSTTTRPTPTTASRWASSRSGTCSSARSDTTPAFTTIFQLHHGAQGAERRQCRGHQHAGRRAEHQRRATSMPSPPPRRTCRRRCRAAPRCRCTRSRPSADRPSCCAPSTMPMPTTLGRHNKLGNRRFIRFNVADARAT